MCIRDRNRQWKWGDVEREAFNEIKTKFSHMIKMCIRDRPIPHTVSNNNTEFNRPRPYYNNNGNKFNFRNDLQQPGDWSCSSCRKKNRANMQHCYQCKTPRNEPRSNNPKQFTNRGAPSTRGTQHHNQGPTRGHQVPTTSNSRPQPEN